jgi:DNA (cytosine-5)-methyltransferase 1
MANYYNEIDLFAAEWLRNLIKEGLIPDGEVDTRSISDVVPNDLAGFTQCHFFAGIAGWSHALRLAGWPDDRPIWTGSCPCQPFSVAGKGKGTADERHLWPVFFNLIRECRPPVVMGEQVSGKAGYGWLDGVRSDLEAEDYACRGVDIPACAVDAPHIRQRLYWVAAQNVDDATGARRGIAGCRPVGPSWDEARRARSERRGGNGGDMANAESQPQREPHDDQRAVSREDARLGSGGRGQRHSVWSDAVWLTGADGKARRAQPDIRLLVDGVPNRVGRLRGYGNAIVPPLVAEVIRAFMDV